MSDDPLRKHRATSKVASVIALLARREKLVEELAAIDEQIEANWTPPPTTRGQPGRKLKYPELEPSIVELTRAGRTQREIAEELNIPHQTVYNILRRHSVSNPTVHRGAAARQSKSKSTRPAANSDDEGEASAHFRARIDAKENASSWEKISIRVHATPEQRAKLAAAADRSGICLPKWMLYEALKEARRRGSKVGPIDIDAEEAASTQKKIAIVVRTARELKGELIRAANRSDLCMSKWMLHALLREARLKIPPQPPVVASGNASKEQAAVPLPRPVPDTAHRDLKPANVLVARSADHAVSQETARVASEKRDRKTPSAKEPPARPSNKTRAKAVVSLPRRTIMDETRGQPAILFTHAVPSEKHTKRSERKSKRDKTSFTADSEAIYSREIGRHDLLGADKEIAITRRLEEVEIETWRILLQGAAADRVRSAIADAHAQEIVDTMNQATPLQLTNDLDATAASIRAFDLDRKHISALLRELQKDDTATIRPLCLEATRLRDTFTRANLRLVVSMAKRFLYTGMPLADLIQEGNLGLMHAVPRFDHRRKLRFSTYATWWIRHELSRAHHNKGSLVRVPSHIHGMSSKVNTATKRLTTELGRSPTSRELAKATGLSLEKLKKLEEYKRGHHTVSLDAPIGSDDGKESSLLDVLVDSRGEESSIVDALSNGEQQARVRRLVDRLSAQEANILRKRFGLDDDNAHTLKEIATIYGVSRERIRQIEAKALAKLRALQGESARERLERPV